MYTIIEDCSPYYIRFTHSGIENIIDYTNKITPNFVSDTFIHHRLSDRQQIETLYNMLPYKDDFVVWKQRMSLFYTSPGMYYRAHKDGLFARVGINYTTKILDDKCVTSWYSDNDLSIYEIDNLPSNSSRECIGFVKSNHIPLKTLTAVQGEAILFNTEIFHDWDNTESNNERIVLTLRVQKSLMENFYFDDAKRNLFG